MNPYFKVARSLLRFIATGLVVIGALMAGLELLRPKAQGGEINFVKMALFALILLAGFILLFTAGKIAARLTDEGDDADDPPDAGGESEAES